MHYEAQSTRALTWRVSGVCLYGVAPAHYAVHGALATTLAAVGATSERARVEEAGRASLPSLGHLLDEVQQSTHYK